MNDLVTTLDLDEVTADWPCPSGELRARLVTGRDGQELLQLRVDLGVLQMFPEGRPDGGRYHGLPSVREYIQHETRVGSAITRDDWDELDRELVQVNYRRMAYTYVSEAALTASDEPVARQMLSGALRDIEQCLALLELLGSGPHRNKYPSLRPTILFDRARLTAQLRIVEAQFEEAIDQALLGAEALEETLAALGCEAEQLLEDPGLCYLRDLAAQLRQEYGIEQTLREQLAEAVEQDDFETAARLRDELSRRQSGRGRAAPAPDDSDRQEPASHRTPPPQQRGGPA